MVIFSTIIRCLQVVTILSVTKLIDGHQVLIISLDGFRYDFLNTYNTSLPTLEFMAKNGVHAINGMQSVYPAMTWANHWSMATGLYTENHRVSDIKYYYDTNRVFNRSASKLYSQDRQDWAGVPIWDTVTLANKSIGVTSWIGSWVDFGLGCQPLDQAIEKISFTSLNDTLKFAYNFLVNDHKDMVMVYWQYPDEAEHMFGSRSSTTFQKLIEIDRQLEQFLERLGPEFLNQLDIVLVSDHGHTDIKKTIYLTNYLDQTNDIEYMISGPIAEITPKPGRLQMVIDGLQKATNNGKLAQWYNYTSLPKEWHIRKLYQNQPEKLLVQGSEGILIYQNWTSFLPVPSDHAFDPRLPSIRPLFVAIGPSFENGHKISKPIELVNYYELFMHLVGVKPLDNNGSLDVWRPILR